MLADAGACYSDPPNPGQTSPIDDLCTLVRDHTGSRPLVDLTARVVWPLLIFAILYLVARVVRRIVDRTLVRSEADTQVRTLVHNVLVFVGLLVAVFGGLTSAGLDLGIFLTVGGLTSLVIGLAFQDVLRNVLAGIFLLLERPFRIGDVISLGDLTGTVATIELRTTGLRLPDGRLAVVPNLDCFTKTVINLTAYERRRFAVSLWVPVGTDLERLLPALRDEMRLLDEVSAEPPPRVQPRVELDGGVTLECQVWLEYRRHDPDAVQAELVRRLYAAAERLAGREVTTPAAEIEPIIIEPPPRQAAAAEEPESPHRAIRIPRRRRPPRAEG